MYQRILVPVDGSAPANGGVQAAIRLARLAAGRVRLVHVVDDLSHVTGYETAETYLGEVKPALHRRAQRTLDDAREQVAAAGVPVECELLDDASSDVATAVRQAALRWHADIVVMGTHGRRGADRLFIGSEAEACARILDLPVLLVPAAAAACDHATRTRAATTAA